MKKYLIMLMLCASVAQAQTKKVLVIGMDGCKASALQHASTPNIDELLETAIYSFDAITHYPTWSSGGWSSLLTGVWGHKHKVFDNSFSEHHLAEYADFLQLIEAHNPDLNTYSVVNWKPINSFIVNGSADHSSNNDKDEEIVRQAIEILSEQDPDVLFVQLDDIDHAGHSYGFDKSVAPYIEAIEATDARIGQLMEALKSRSGYGQEDWLILLSPDHGGTLKGHGGATIEERNTFLIVSNKNLASKNIQKKTQEQAIGSQLNFDGQTYLLPSSSFSFGESQDFTIELKVRFSNPEGDACIIGNKDWESGANKGFAISTSNDDLSLWKVNIGDGSDRADLVASNIADGAWHSIAVSFKRGGKMRLYEDGEEAGWQDISNIDNIDSGLPLAIGQDGTLSYPHWFKGSIAEVRIWNAALPKKTINQYMCAPVDASHPNYGDLLAYWKISEGKGKTAYDASSRKNHCQVKGNSLWQTSKPCICVDYSQTPRMTDIAPTILSYLCIPFQKEAFDGRPIKVFCVGE